MNSWRLGLRLMVRDWRGGELHLLAAAILIAVAAVSSVAWLAERIGAASSGRAAELMAADLVVRSNDAIPQEWLTQAHALGLQTARTLELASVVLAQQRPQLVGLKAVEQGYPLRGSLRVSVAPGAPEQTVRQVPPPGEAWVEPRLLAMLDIDVGDSIELGAASLRVARVLTFEPDRGGFFTGVAPRVLINHEDLAATELVQPASRVDYSLLLAGPEGALERYRGWLEGQSEPQPELVTPGQEQPGVQEVIDKAQRFLGLGALLTVVIAGVAMLLTTRRYAARQLDRIAIMRCLGATQRQIGAVLTWELVWLGLLGGALGILLGYVLHLAMLSMVREFLPPDLPRAGLRPALSGWLTSLAALLGFALPTVLRLKKVPPLRVLRRELGGDVFRGVGLYLLALAVIFLLMWWQAGDLPLAAAVFAAVLAALLALFAVAGLMVACVRLWRRRGGGGLLWLAGISRRPATAIVQIVGVGIGLMALFLLGVVREDLLDAWAGRIDAQAPNHFLVNVQPQQVDGLQDFLRERAGITAALDPMVRGRLDAINGERVRPEDFEEPRTQRLVAREFNLSWAQDLPQGNRIASGDWWAQAQPDGKQFSLEAGLAERLGVSVGDRLTFRIAGERVSAEITNLRLVEWDSFEVNFFVISPPELLNDFPATYITSFYLPSEHQPLISELVQRYPSVTVIDVSALLATVREIIGQGSRVVEVMALLTLVAGLLVLFAALQVTGEERRFESAMLRALGARRARIRRIAAAEFCLIGAAAGGLAGVVAVLAGHLLAQELFALYYPINLNLVVFAVLAGAALVWSAGALGTRKAYAVSPMRLLRETREG